MANNIDLEKQYLAAYSESGNFIRHHSTLRATLVSFLITLGTATLIKYKEVPGFDFLWNVGVGVLVASFIVNLFFSHRNEKYSVYQKHIWKWFSGEIPSPPSTISFEGSLKLRLVGMGKDLLNYVCLAVIWLIIQAIPQ